MSVSVYELDSKLSTLNVPVKVFGKLIEAVKNNDFSKVDDALATIRYRNSENKYGKYIEAAIYQTVYRNKEYDSLLEIITKIMSIFDSMVEARLHITDMTNQSYSVVIDFLSTFGFELAPMYGQKQSTDIARNIYYYVRRKGTPYLLAMMLEQLGITHFQINEYDVNKSNKYGWVLTPVKVYETLSAKTMTYTPDDIMVRQIPISTWLVDDNELDVIFGIGGDE